VVHVEALTVAYRSRAMPCRENKVGREHPHWREVARVGGGVLSHRSTWWEASRATWCTAAWHIGIMARGGALLDPVATNRQRITRKCLAPITP
jgi:hypothetical protein